MFFCVQVKAPSVWIYSRWQWSCFYLMKWCNRSTSRFFVLSTQILKSCFKFSPLKLFSAAPRGLCCMSCYNKQQPAAAEGTIYVLKMPSEPSLIKRDETSVVFAAVPGEMLHGCKYWFCWLSPCGMNVVDLCGGVFALINDLRLKVI